MTSDNGRASPPTDLVVPLRLETIRQDGHDELNVARLALISAQSRVPPTYTSWQRTYTSGERTVTVTCKALTGEVVPHGIDNDVMVAIINLYIEDGAGEDGTIRTTLHRLLQAAGLAATAHYYREVKQSLRRLQSTSYQIVQGWWVKGRERHIDATFNYLWKVTTIKEGQDDAGSGIEIRLPDEIAQSIREGYLKPLNLGLYRELSSPPVRAVYRVLDALRWETGKAQDQVTVNLLEWGERLSIYSSEPDKIRRVLQPAHQELQEKGVLQEVIQEGRGKNQQITYIFEPLEHVPDPELLNALIKRGMYPGVAGRFLADNQDPAPVYLALKRFDAYPGKKQNNGALLRDMLLNPERYADVLPVTEEGPSSEKSVKQLVNTDAEDVAQKQREEFLALPMERRLKRIEAQLNLSRLTLLLSAEEHATLKQAVTDGRLDSLELLNFLAHNIKRPTEQTLADLRAMISRS